MARKLVLKLASSYYRPSQIKYKEGKSSLHLLASLRAIIYLTLHVSLLKKANMVTCIVHELLVYILLIWHITSISISLKFWYFRFGFD